MDIFVFASSIISLILATLIIYLLCKCKQIRTLIRSLVLHQVKEVGASSKENNSECKSLAYIGIILTILSLIIVTFLHYRKSRFCKGHKLSNALKIMMFISDVQNYVPVKLCKTAGNIHLFKIKGMLKPENIKLNKNYLWDTMEIDWKEVTVTFNNNKIDLPKVILIKLWDKTKVGGLMNREPLLFSHDDKAGNNVVHSSNRNTRNSINIKIYFQCFNFRWPASYNLSVISCTVF